MPQNNQGGFSGGGGGASTTLPPLAPSPQHQSDHRRRTTSVSPAPGSGSVRTLPPVGPSSPHHHQHYPTKITGTNITSSSSTYQPQQQWYALSPMSSYDETHTNDNSSQHSPHRGGGVTAHHRHHPPNHHEKKKKTNLHLLTSSSSNSSKKSPTAVSGSVDDPLAVAAALPPHRRSRDHPLQRGGGGGGSQGSDQGGAANNPPDSFTSSGGNPTPTANAAMVAFSRLQNSFRGVSSGQFFGGPPQQHQQQQQSTTATNTRTATIMQQQQQPPYRQHPLFGGGSSQQRPSTVDTHLRDLRDAREEVARERGERAGLFAEEHHFRQAIHHDANDEQQRLLHEVKRYHQHVRQILRREATRSIAGAAQDAKIHALLEAAKDRDTALRSARRRAIANATHAIANSVRSVGDDLREAKMDADHATLERHRSNTTHCRVDGRANRRAARVGLLRDRRAAAAEERQRQRQQASGRVVAHAEEHMQRRRQVAASRASELQVFSFLAPASDKKEHHRRHHRHSHSHSIRGDSGPATVPTHPAPAPSSTPREGTSSLFASPVLSTPAVAILPTTAGGAGGGGGATALAAFSPAASLSPGASPPPAGGAPSSYASGTGAMDGDLLDVNRLLESGGVGYYSAATRGPLSSSMSSAGHSLLLHQHPFLTSGAASPTTTTGARNPSLCGLRVVSTGTCTDPNWEDDFPFEDDETSSGDDEGDAKQ